MSFRDFLRLLLVLSVTLGGGAVAGALSGRWGPPPSQLAAGAALADAPREFGDWQLAEETPLSDEVLEMLRCTGYVSRRYAHRRTGEWVQVLVLSGPPGEISCHTPEVCYKGQGLKQTGRSTHVTVPLPAVPLANIPLTTAPLNVPPTLAQAEGGGAEGDKVEGAKAEGDRAVVDRAEADGDRAEGDRAEFWRTPFVAESRGGQKVAVYYGWSGGGPWSAPAWPRFAFAGLPYLYKIQLNAPILPGAKGDERDLGREFLAEFVAALGRQGIPQKRRE